MRGEWVDVGRRRCLRPTLGTTRGRAAAAVPAFPGAGGIGRSSGTGDRTARRGRLVGRRAGHARVRRIAGARARWLHGREPRAPRQRRGRRARLGSLRARGPQLGWLDRRPRRGGTARADPRSCWSTAATSTMRTRPARASTRRSKSSQRTRRPPGAALPTVRPSPRTWKPPIDDPVVEAFMSGMTDDGAGGLARGRPVPPAPRPCTT